MVLVSNGLLILNPLVFRRALMAVGSDVSGDWRSSIWAWAALLLAIALVSAYFKYQMRLTFISISRDAEVDIRSILFRKIQNQSMAFFDSYGVGELLSRLTNDISLYRDLLGPGIMYPLFSLTLVVPGLAGLYTISPKLANVALIPLMVIPFVNYALHGQLYRLALGVQRTLGNLSKMVQEQFSAVRIIKSYVSEGEARNYFLRLCSRLLRLEIRASVLEGSLYPFFTLVTKIVTVLLVMYSGMIILGDEADLSMADFISFMWIQSYIFFPVLMMGWLIPVYEKGRAAYDRLFEIYTQPIEVKDTPESIHDIPPQASIELRGLTYTYPGSEKPSLNGIDLTIQGGTFLGITGPIGSGKTTLLRLLNREYEVPEGMILIGGRDIHEYSLKAFNAAMAAVDQVPFLFSKSIAENVKFGRREATVEQMQLVAEFADFHETVLEFPEQYDTLVGERGVTLSGGQKQRLAIARAFLVDRSILLLDDIFSAVDAETEKRIFNAMRQNFKGKTVLLITHRASILKQSDRILYFHEGKIVEDGSHEELVALGGHYAALTELQKLTRKS